MEDKIEMKCEKCGKSPEIDEEKSNENWTVYKMDCECGGKIRFINTPLIPYNSN